MYVKSAPIKTVISISKTKATMVKAKPTATHTAGVDISYLTKFTKLLVS